MSEDGIPGGCRPGAGRWEGAARRAARTAAAALLLLPAAAAAQAPAPDLGLGDGPVLLSDLARAAIDRSRDVTDARLQVGTAERQVSEAWSRVYPSLDLSTSYTRNVAPQVSFLPAQIFDPSAAEGDFIPIQFGADNLWNLSVNAEQALVEPAVFVGVGAAAQFRGLQQEALRGRTQAAVTRVRIGFYDLLLAQEEARLTRNSLQRVRQSLEETVAMTEAGISELYDVLRLEVELANLEPSLRRAENRRRAARRAIASELAADPEAEIEVAGELAQMDLDDFEANSPANRDILGFSGVPGGGGGDLADLVRRGTADRSDVRQLALTERLRRTEMRLEQVEYLPTLSAFGTYGLAAQQNGGPDFFGTPLQRGSTKQVGLRLSFSLFSGFLREARIGQRRMALRQAETQTLVAEDAAAIEIGNLVDGAAEARERARGQRLAVSQAQRGFEIASAQYREGLGSQLELTDAEVALRQSEFNYAQAVYDYLVARARLDEASGRVPLVDVEPVGAGGEEADDGSE